MSDSATSDLQHKIRSLETEVDELKNLNADLNERLKAHSAINSGQISFINNLIDKVPTGVMVLDEELNIIHANPTAQKIFSSDMATMDGQPSSNYFIRKIDVDINTEEQDLDLHHLRCVDSDKHIMHSSFICKEGSKKIVIESFIDVSEIKYAERELLKINKVKDEFLGMISHELRSPLNVIHGYSSLLEEELHNIENKDILSYIENITQAGQTLLVVVDNLLDLSNLTAGNVHIDEIPIDVDMVMVQLQYRLEKEFDKKGNKLTFNNDGVISFVQDLSLLMKIFYEILSNANKFTINGEVNVSISFLKKDNKDWLSFKVSDTGCGMDEESINQIFSAFHQADSTLSRSHEGLGLGLSLVEKMVRVINGDIQVSSELGVGTEFSVLLPYVPVPT